MLQQLCTDMQAALQGAPTKHFGHMITESCQGKMQLCF